MSDWLADEPTNDDRELDPHERELIEACGFDPDDPEDVDCFYQIERENEVMGTDDELVR